MQHSAQQRALSKGTERAAHSGPVAAGLIDGGGISPLRTKSAPLERVCTIWHKRGRLKSCTLEGPWRGRNGSVPEWCGQQ